MKILLNILSILLFIPLVTSAQISHRFHETFAGGNAEGWVFTALDANIYVQNGKLHVNSSSDDFIYIIPPIGAVKDDFSFKVIGGENGEVGSGGFGRAGFNSILAILVTDDSVHVIYSENFISYTEPNLTWLYGQPHNGGINSLQLDAKKSGNNLIIDAYINNSLIYNGTLINVIDDLLYGQMVIGIESESAPIAFSLDEIDIRFNPAINPPGMLNEQFNTPTVPWFKFVDLDYAAQSITIGGGRLNFNLIAPYETSLLIIPPVGAVSDFPFEVVAGGEGNHDVPFTIGRFFNYKNYVAVWFEDSIYIGYGKNSIDPVVVNTAPYSYVSLLKVQFEVTESVPVLTLKVWINDLLTVTGTVPNADSRLAVGQLVAGFDAGTIFDAYIDYALINYTQFITNIDDEVNTNHLDFRLEQNYPNPFNPVTNINFYISSNQFVSLKVYDLLGREAADLVNEEKSAGSYEVIFDGSSLSSGVYLYRLQTSDYNVTKKMMLIR